MGIFSEIKQRALAPTPPFFKKLKRIGLVIAAVGTAVLTAPGSVPAALLLWAGHAVTAGTILVTITQLTVDENQPEDGDASLTY
jgi:hypothetical protein